MIILGIFLHTNIKVNLIHVIRQPFIEVSPQEKKTILITHVKKTLAFYPKRSVFFYLEYRKK
jgi:hypothetical protein